MELLVVGGLVVVVGWFLLGRKGSQPARQGATKAASQKAHSKYHAVEIHVGLNACEAALKLRGKPYLSREAPLLPLADCTRGKCDCRYQHRDDRRKSDDRRDGMDTTYQSVQGAERRNERHDRRKIPFE